MPTIQVAGISTNYEQIGSGPLLVLLHGWANTWEAWLPVIPFLSDYFTLILPDLPGCGRTETPQEGWSTATHAQWLEELLNTPIAHNSQLKAICGHSYGGKILLEYCSGKYQPQPQKIVLIDASGIPNVLNKKQQLLAKLALLTPQFLKDTLNSSVRGKIYAQFGADSDYISANDFQKQTLNLILKEDYTEKLASIAQQTLILWGKSDESTPLWQGESMSTLIPLNKLLTFDSGHFPHHTYPKEVSDAIIQCSL